MQKNIQLTCQQFDNKEEARAALLAVQADPQGAEIMAEKAVFKVIKLEAVPVRAANLLKQTFLAKGGDAAVSRATAAFAGETTDVLLMGTLKVYRLAVAEMKRQPFGLRAMAEALENFLFRQDFSADKQNI